MGQPLFLFLDTVISNPANRKKRPTTNPIHAFIPAGTSKHNPAPGTTTLSAAATATAAAAAAAADHNPTHHASHPL
jgi:hypothetical protein